METSSEDTKFLDNFFDLSKYPNSIVRSKKVKYTLWDPEKHITKKEVREIIEDELTCDWDDYWDRHNEKTCDKCLLLKRLE